MADVANSEKRQVQVYFDAFKANTGNPAVVTQAMVKKLREIGVDGPYIESKPIPSV